MTTLPEADLETVASGLAFFGLAGFVLKQIFKGWFEAKTGIKVEPTTPSMVAVASAVWDRDQVERVIQLLESMSLALSGLNQSQATLVNRQQQEMNEHLEELVDRMRNMPVPSRRRRPAKKRPGD